MNDAISGKWQVHNYLDQSRTTRFDLSLYGWTLLDTEAQARAFIVQRAKDEVTKAEAELAAARRRLKKCQKKFAPVGQPNVTPLEPSK